MTPTSIAAYLALFVALGFVFLFANLLVGWLLRPKSPNAEKLEIYECGEPTIGSSFVQFDLRFYVVALLFIIFDVEVAFFFPWATVYGKGNQLRDLGTQERAEVAADIRGQSDLQETDLARLEARAAGYQSVVADKFSELGVTNPDWPRILQEPPASSSNISPDAVTSVGQIGNSIVKTAMIDIAVFFAVLMVGFFYVWKRGDLDWVRALSRERAAQAPRRPPGAPVETLTMAAN
ncbi:MAG: NADH-quinone oxidoreductase subunit A [Pirellulales bacterium]